VLGLGLVAVLGLGGFLPGALGAGRPHEAPKAALKHRQTRLAARSEQALLGLFALDSRLAQARGDLGRLRGRAAALRAVQEQVRREIAVVEGTVRASQRLLGDRLRILYEEGEPNPIAILLGASSLDDAVIRLDELDRSARQGAQAAVDAKDGRTRLKGLALELAAQVREVQALEGQAAQTAGVLSSARAQRIAYLRSLARQRRFTAHEIKALASRSSHVVQRAQAVQAKNETGPPTLVAVPTVQGARTLTVTATGYSLPGHTATGLPVGFGVVAVDPAVIPLGTRLTIPGYGEGVAADTGTAVQGNTIDLWFPTLTDAMALGRRTVTITLH
jgi:3D (Asp-Asp-Asp) domain-containing protein/peptidoglycan hydrolase CwlO-like protein